MKLAIFVLLVSAAQAQPKPELLYSEGAPGAVGQEDTDKPSITAYLPHNGNGQAVIVCPGGGYRNLAMDHEGVQIAQWLNSQGIAAFILKYRLGPRYHHPAMLLDIQRAIRTVRARAKTIGVSPNRIGVMGFSAGGHLAATAGTHFDYGAPNTGDAIGHVSSRPDFMVLCYPVISFTTEFTHQGSKTNLLGDNPAPGLVDLLSNERQVRSDTPPTFLFHTNEDTGVPPENSVYFYLALRKAKVSAEMHIYEQGRHGVGLAHTDLALSSWSGRLAEWLRRR